MNARQRRVALRLALRNSEKKLGRPLTDQERANIKRVWVWWTLPGCEHVRRHRGNP